VGVHKVMDRKDKLGLLEFMTGGELPCRILVLEKKDYLPALRQMFPQGELWCTLAEGEGAAEPEFAGLDVQWCHVDYLAQRLPLQEKYYDYILGEDCLENAANPQDIASGLGLYLKDTGYLLLSFLNIRYWRVIQNLMEGHFYYLCSRIFARAEMNSLLAASFYKDVRLLPVRGEEPPEGLIEGLEAAGFENIGDELQVERWLLQAAKSTPEIMELKRMYTPQLRARLAVLLRRLEYGIAHGIDGGDNLSELWELCGRELVFPAYLASFIREAVIHINDLLWQLSPWRLDREKQDFWSELLAELSEAYEDSGDRYLVEGWQQGRPEPAYAEQPGELAAPLPEGSRIAFITCVNNEAMYQEAVLYLRQLHLPPGLEAEFIPVRGAASMCRGYNLGAARTRAGCKVYLHQDTLIVNKNFVFDLLRIFADKSVGALGVIGARQLPASGVWWDAMRTYGRVLHACEPECVVETACMEPPDPWIEAEAVDGLLVAVQTDVTWREELFDGWHFYEISMCKELQRRGYKVVIPHQQRFWCIHAPKEKPLAPAYKVFQKRFLREYGGELQPEIQ